MRRLYILSFIVLLLSACSRSNSSRTSEGAILDLPPDATAAQLLALVNLHPEIEPSSPELAKVEVVGRRLNAWLAHVNEVSGQRLAFHTPETIQAFPIESPREYNEEIVIRKYQNAMAAFSTEPSAILQDDSRAFPDTFLLNAEEFIRFGRELNLAYELAMRWRLSVPDLEYFTRQANADVRGYYYLMREENLLAKLAAWSSLESDVRDRYYEQLLSLCLNSMYRPRADCAAELDGKIAEGKVTEFYESYLTICRFRYNSYFTIFDHVKRRDATWSVVDGVESLIVPFLRPESSALADMVQQAIQHWWKLDHWSLQLPLVTTPAETLSRITTAPGVTPTAQLGGTTITMDANSFQDNYETRWTLAHEFGHLLGFNDCYVEFYDEARGVMINYQIDTDNIMCSRRGRVLPSHIEELKRVYGTTAAN